jgi:hypothetical protein
MSRWPFGVFSAICHLVRPNFNGPTFGWVEPTNVPVGQPGLLCTTYTPGDLGFDPLALRPWDPEALRILQTKELQNGCLAMLAPAGFMAQELHVVDDKGIVENHHL